MQDIKSIAILRALQLGDFLCSVPAIRALRTAYPKAKIAWIGLPNNAHLQQRFSHYIDEFIPFPGYPGLPEQKVDPTSVEKFISQMQRKSFDIALQMQGNGTYVNELVSLFNARYCAGFYKPGNYRPNDVYFIPYPEGLHEVKRHLLLVQHIGIPALDKTLEFPFTLDLDCLTPNVQDRQYVCIHPGSRGEQRRWDPTLFAQMADLIAKAGYMPVLTGSKEELDIVESVIEQMHYPAIIKAGSTNLDQMATLLRHAKGLLSNCTGVAHMAYALQTPAVVISMDGEAHRWGQYHSAIHRTINWFTHPNLHSVQEAIENIILNSYPPMEQKDSDTPATIVVQRT